MKTLKRINKKPVAEFWTEFVGVDNAVRAFSGETGVPVWQHKVDGRAIGDGKPGAMTGRLRKQYQALTCSEGTPISG